jgi:hypothetical protein
LSGIIARNLAVPFDKELERFVVFENSVQARQSQAFNSRVALFDQLKQHLQPPNIKKVRFRPSVPEHGLSQAVEHCNRKSGLIA